MLGAASSVSRTRAEQAIGCRAISSVRCRYHSAAKHSEMSGSGIFSGEICRRPTARLATQESAWSALLGLPLASSVKSSLIELAREVGVTPQGMGIDAAATRSNS